MGIKELAPRWITYNDWITNSVLLASCVALYDESVFKGVTCMDMNVILDVATLQSKSDYSSVFQPALITANTNCPLFDFKALGIKIDKLRERIGGQSCLNQDENENSILAIILWTLGVILVIVIVSLAI